uniref:Uncharacterized protein n=1 Tax=Kwoniella bestiolae CBS 10118 TaxID=1296100 RepID=A0A1B9GFV7_9TREE|nr:hypothetical protein I302_01354 [Kwoniella bestiolae CBS 10118]OCF29841.1 hypothetical protein I302_01354 [Kwoniella bestiolae CBS 10118]
MNRAALFGTDCPIWSETTVELFGILHIVFSLEMETHFQQKGFSLFAKQLETTNALRSVKLPPISSPCLTHRRPTIPRRGAVKRQGSNAGGQGLDRKALHLRRQESDLA